MQLNVLLLRSLLAAAFAAGSACHLCMENLLGVHLIFPKLWWPQKFAPWPWQQKRSMHLILYAIQSFSFKKCELNVCKYVCVCAGVFVSVYEWGLFVLECNMFADEMNGGPLNKTLTESKLPKLRRMSKYNWCAVKKCCL